MIIFGASRKIHATDIERKSRMDTKDLRFFRQVYETGSINKASRQLFITPQGLSKVIRHLEEELQADLFQRSANGMVPMESGRYLYDNCGSLLEQFDALTLEIRQLRDRNRKLGIGFSCGVLNVFPFQKMETYKKQYSQITLQWEESSNQEIIHKIQQGILDLGFVIGPAANQELWAEEVFSRTMNVVVYEGHPFFQRDSISVNDLREEPLITLNEKYYSYHSLLQRCQDFGFTPSIVVKTMESQLIYQFCRQKTGLGIDADIHRDKSMMSGLHLIPLYDSIPWKIFLVIRKDRRKEPAIAKMAELFLPA